MKLNELLAFNDIVIQCHDNPDADALASGYALLKYLRKNGKDARFIYRGRNRITKSNLRIMMDELEIPVTYEPEFDKVPELLVNVDCQYGQRNVTTTPARNIAIIDHHKTTTSDLPELNEIRSNIGSCATVIWSMLKAEGIEPNDSSRLATALCYGLYTDTNKYSEIAHPLDRDMIDDLTNANKSLIREMSNSNISLEELKITGKAILGYEYLRERGCLMIEAEPCDPNILGVISDFSLETENVDCSIAYYDTPEEIKFSVRSCSRTIHANDLAAFIAEGIGGGGGHICKAGGTIRPEKIDEPAREVMKKRLEEYFSLYTIMYAKDTTLDTSDMKCYTKLEQELGTVKLTDVFPEGTRVSIRTMEGDIDIRVDDGTYLMIGLEGEVYPINEKKLKGSYRFLDHPYSATFEYEPSIKDSITGETKHISAFAKPVMSSGKAFIYARPLESAVKLFTAWDEERYYLGNIGDYLAVRTDDPHDIYLVSGALFDRLYKECSPDQIP